MTVAVGPSGVLALITHVDFLDGDRCHIVYRLAERGIGNATGDFGFTPEVGDVVLIGDGQVVLQPRDLWAEPTSIDVVRLKTDDYTVVGHDVGLRTIPTSGVEYFEGYTVEYNTDQGVVAVVSPGPLRSIDAATIDDHLIASRFLVDDPAPLSFDDFGGSPKLVERARRLIELPLLRRDLLAEMRARPPKGVLMTGPPGVGKTLLAQIIASTTDAAFYQISGPEVFSKWVGESEELLRTLFAHASRRGSAIVFFDEIDSIAAKRSEDRNRTAVQVVAQLLTLMDGFDRTTNVVVVAATNRRDDIDEALLRPGRFDSELAFALPTLKDRTEILMIGAKRHRCDSRLPHDLVAAETEGWSSAELAGIWTEAALLAVEEGRSRILTEDYLGGVDQVAERRRLEGKR